MNKPVSGLTRERSMPVLIFLVALTMQVAALARLPQQYSLLKVDARQYDDLAVNMLSGKGYFTEGTGMLTRSWKPPAYPLFLAGIYSIFGHNLLAVRIIQSVLAALSCVIIFFIGKIIFNKKVGLVSAFALAIYPPYVFNYYCGPATLFSETFLVFLLSLTVLLASRGLLGGFKFSNLALIGFLTGVLALTRSFFALLPFILLFLIFFKNEYSFSRTIKMSLPLVAGFILVILPWAARNYLVHRAFVPFTTQGGYVLLGGNNRYASGGGLTDLDILFSAQEKEALSKMTEAEQDRFCRQYAKAYMLKNYKQLPRMFIKKLLVQWDVFDTVYDPAGRTTARRYNGYYGTVLIFCVLGIAMASVAGVNLAGLLIILLFAYFSVMAMIFHGDPRFRYPAEAFMVVFAGYGVFAVRKAIKNKSAAYLAIGIIIAANFLFYLYSDLILNWVRRII